MNVSTVNRVAQLNYAIRIGLQNFVQIGLLCYYIKINKSKPMNVLLDTIVCGDINYNITELQAANIYVITLVYFQCPNSVIILIHARLIHVSTVNHVAQFNYANRKGLQHFVQILCYYNQCNEANECTLIDTNVCGDNNYNITEL
jgi:hypothetical protein